jgi:DNA mismatch endonuclease (patch repair protein)
LADEAKRTPAEKRSATMRAVRRSGTKLEATLEAKLRAAGLDDFESQARDLPGTPDFVFRDRRIAVFIDSCYWHGCPSHLRMPVSNRDYWVGKIKKNRERDARQTAELELMGYRVERIWEHELEGGVARRLQSIFD